MQTPLFSVVAFLIAALLGAAGQFLYKAGVHDANSSLLSYLNPKIFGGVVCYVAVMVLFMAAFKRGGSLMVLYPLYASTFIWAAVIGYLIEGTALKGAQLAGIGIIVFGMALMGKTA